MTKWLVADTKHVQGGKLEYQIKEHPLLHVCCNEDHFGDVNVDIRPEVKPDIVADVTKGLPFKDNEFAAAFADFPWINAWRWNAARAIREMLRVAPIVYTISPWLYGARTCYPAEIQVSWRPGINVPILWVKYVRREVKPLVWRKEDPMQSRAEAIMEEHPELFQMLAESPI